MSNDRILDVDGLGVRYGGVRAVDDLSLSVHRGEIVGLIGPNGAGKTSAIDGITGYVQLAGGTVTLRGEDVTRWPAHRRARAGLVRTFQQLELFTELSVEDNLHVAARATKRGDQSTVDASLEMLELTGVRHQLASGLPQGARRLAAIARAVASRPELLLLDEPAAGLDQTSSAAVQQRLTTLAETGMGIILVEHDIALVMNVCDRIVVIDFGVTIGSGTPDDVRNDPRIIEAYLGTESSAAHA